MEVIGVGFGRTGTATLKQALEILGFGPTYHTREIFRDPSRLADWEQAVAGKPVDWDRIFDGYRSVVDWPAAAFWRELVARYPDARVILTVRDPREWHRSCMRTIFLNYRTGPLSRAGMAVLRLPLKFADRRLRNFNAVFDSVFRRHFGDGPIADEDYAVEIFERHVQEVIATVPADRLLVYRVQEGWPRLCDFLGVGVTFKPYPHDNDQKSFYRTVRRFVSRGAGRVVTAPIRLFLGRSARRRAAQGTPEAG